MTDRSIAEGAPQQRIALDAMGGDLGPAATVAGALRARAHGVDVVLVGVPDLLQAELARHRGEAAMEIVAADEVVGMDEDPAIALRTKRGASIRVAAALVASGGAEALVSTGSTGATLAAGLLEIGRLRGVRRPAVAAVLPSGAVLIDAGASPDVQPEALLSYASMGAAYAQVRGVGEVRIGLLNVGEEPGKGSAAVKAAHAVLGAHPQFAGNVEPAAVLDGAVDVVVTDGFTGNIFLKTLEAAGRNHARGGAVAPGAAILLGCAKPVLVGHGAADPEEIAAALRTAAAVVSADLTGRLEQALARSPAPAAAPAADRTGDGR